MSASTTVSTVAAASVLMGIVALSNPVAAGPANAERGDNRPQDRRCARQFDKAVERYVETTDARDTAGFNRLLHPDVTAVLPGGYTLIGEADVAEFIDGFFARTDWTQTLEVKHTAVSGCGTAHVLFDSVYTDGDGAVPLAIIITWTRDRGQWRVIVDQNTVVDA